MHLILVGIVFTVTVPEGKARWSRGRAGAGAQTPLCRAASSGGARADAGAQVQVQPALTTEVSKEPTWAILSQQLLFQDFETNNSFL